MNNLLKHEKYDLDNFYEGSVKSKQTTEKIENKNLWKVIAKNELKLRTSKFRNNRIVFFAGMFIILFLWAFVGAPLLFDLFMPTISIQYTEIFKPLIGTLIESFSMIMFLFLMMYPLNNVYGKAEVGFKESLLATPVSEGEIFLGEFLGKMPIYSFAVLLFAPIVVGLINPIIDLNLIHYFTIYFCSFGLVFLANLTGSIIASWIEHKISKSEKARDLGKALIMVLTIVMVIIMYSVIFFLNDLMSNPSLKNWVMFYPSLWYSNIILYAIDPILLQSYVLNMWFSLLLSIAVPSLVLYLSYKKAVSFYSVEGMESFTRSKVESENIFYSILRKVVGRKWGGLMVVQMKRFLRRKANLARIAYVLGLLGFMTWMTSSWSDDEGVVISSAILIVIGGALGSIMLGHLVFIESKDVLWVYKRSSRGIKGVVYSYLLSMLIFSIFIAIFATVLRLFFMALNIVDIVLFSVFFVTNMEATMIQAVGLECKSPGYEEKDANLKGNTMVSMLIQQPAIFIPIFLIIVLRPESLLLTYIIGFAPLIGYNILVAIPLIFVGMKRLKNLE